MDADREREDRLRAAWAKLDRALKALDTQRAMVSLKDLRPAEAEDVGPELEAVSAALANLIAAAGALDAAGTPSPSDARPVMALRPDASGALDDVVIERPKMFRAEMMSEGHLWLACYFDNGEEIAFGVTAEKKGVLDFHHNEVPDHVDWDERRAALAEPGAGTPSPAASEAICTCGHGAIRHTDRPEGCGDCDCSGLQVAGTPSREAGPTEVRDASVLGIGAKYEMPDGRSVALDPAKLILIYPKGYAPSESVAPAD